MTLLKIIEPHELFDFGLKQDLLDEDSAAGDAVTVDLLPPVAVHSAHPGHSVVRLPPAEMENRQSFVLRFPEALIGDNLGVIYEGFLIPGGFGHSPGWISHRYRRLNEGWCEDLRAKPVVDSGRGSYMLGGLFHWGHFFVDVLDRLLLLQKRGLLDRPLITDDLEPCANVMALIRKAGIAVDPRNFLRASTAFDHLVQDFSLPTLASSKPAIPSASFRALRDIVTGQRNEGPPAPGDTLFVGRSKVKHRHIVNQENVFAYLERTGHGKAILPEFLDIDQAMNQFASAPRIMLPIGSAKFNLIFCAPGTKVVCITPEGYAETDTGVTGMVRHICQALDLKLCFYSCAIQKKQSILLNSDLILAESDIRKVVGLLDSL
jgi:capsular polysaccharide biosynthesis protein